MGFIENLLGRVSGKTILFYPGCAAKFASPKILKNYERLLSKMNIIYVTLFDEEHCCGSPAREAGYDEDFKNLVEYNKNLFKERGIRKIITPSPSCYLTFKRYYNFEDVEVEHISVTIKKALDTGLLKPAFNRRIVAYHDSCSLGRGAKIFDEPRQVLQALGYNLRELAYNREDAFCCGACGGVKANHPETANLIAKDRMKEMDLVNVDTLITSSLLCAMHLKENAGGRKILEFSEAVLNAVE